MRTSRIALVLAFIAFVAIGITASSLDGLLVPRLELENPAGWVAGDESPMLRYTLDNTGRETLQLLRWQTPLAGIEHDILEVTLDGKPVPYSGKLIKRAAPQPADYVVIKPGETLTVLFDPSSAYDMTPAGDYTIRYRTSLTDVKIGDAKAAVVAFSREDIESNEVAFFFEGLPQTGGGPATRAVDCDAKPCHPKCPPNPELCGGGEDPGGDPSVDFVACTAQQQSKALAAVANATTMSADAYDDLADGSSPLYETWFGAYKANRYNTVTGHFDAIANAFATQTVTINCTDADLPYYAYVYAGSPYEIYVCYYFFHAPATGRDSAAGTLVHEMSHFNVVAGTVDYVYGEANAMWLAATDPRKAIKNADNHEYFAEDQ
jgi:peptidyl-Lys metalloendopeptidase